MLFWKSDTCFPKWYQILSLYTNIYMLSLWKTTAEEDEEKE